MKELITRYNKSLTVTLVILGFIMIGISILLIPENEKTFNKIVDIIGTYASVFGLLIAILQIYSIKNLSVETKNAADKAITKLNEMFAISDLSRANVLIDEIQIYLRNKNFDASVMRLKDLKIILSKANHIKAIQILIDDNYKGIIVDYEIDLNNILYMLNGEKQDLDIGKMVTNLEKLKNKFLDFENKLINQ